MDEMLNANISVWQPLGKLLATFSRLFLATILPPCVDIIARGQTVARSCGSCMIPVRMMAPKWKRAPDASDASEILPIKKARATAKQQGQSVVFGNCSARTRTAWPNRSPAKAKPGQVITTAPAFPVLR